ncbi:hypothetical protein [Thermoactinomyces mirandus]|uniref:hypothetical protein n=1 Tax=Thermoactinomyces mirandus TaxID=2756294 RepID=UPI0015EEFD5F|nr:hypothetical protein [Thermoactinomyces mirandus]
MLPTLYRKQMPVGWFGYERIDVGAAHDLNDEKLERFVEIMADFSAELSAAKR